MGRVEKGFFISQLSVPFSSGFVSYKKKLETKNREQGKRTKKYRGERS